MSNLAPLSLTKHSSTEMFIKWNNGEESIVPFIDLRFFCKCAECVEEWTRKRKIKKGDIKPDIKPLNLEVVGRYAVQINWSDGHKAGIYPFDLLYSIAKGAEK